MTEFSHIVSPETVRQGGQSVHLDPSQEQRAAIAKRLDLIDLPAFSATIELQWDDLAGVLRLTGEVTATVTQRCVVSLKPVTAEIDYPFVERYGRQAVENEQEITVSADDDADLDSLPDDGLDLAEIAVQHLSLALDPYPRAVDAELDGHGVAEIGQPTGPFAKLSVLRGGKK